MGEACSRRSFLKSGAIIAAGVAGMSSLAGCSTTEKASYLPDTWTEEADMVIVGMGGAGAAAAITASLEGLGSTIVLEAGPEGEEGGNTRVSGNYVFCPESVDGALEYQTALNGDYAVPEENMKAWAEELCKNVDWLNSIGADMKVMNAYSPEIAGIDGGDSVKVYCNNGEHGNESTWLALKAQIDSLGINVKYGTRATKLVRNPDTNEALGVIATKEDGTTVYYKAKKGVILSCGGFENNPDMLKTYYGMTGTTDIRPLGTPHNQGDGFNMISPFGAKLWHMNNYAGPSICGLAAGNDYHGCFYKFGPKTTKDWIFVGPNAERFAYEETMKLAAHGKVKEGGTYMTLRTPMPSWMVFGPDTYAVDDIMATYVAGWTNSLNLYASSDGSNAGYLKAGVFITSDTIEGLATQMGLDPATLANTISTYNGYAAAGKDEDWGRGEAVYGTFSGTGGSGGGMTTDTDSVVVKPFDLVPINGPYYAMKIVAGILNTQGGPMRNPQGGLMDAEGNDIPHLFGAGEFGCEYSFLYNAGGNVSEALSSGRIAVRSAAENDDWDAKN